MAPSALQEITEPDLFGMYLPPGYLAVPIYILCGLIVALTKFSFIFYTLKHAVRGRAMNWLVMNDQVKIARSKSIEVKSVLGSRQHCYR